MGEGGRGNGQFLALPCVMIPVMAGIISSSTRGGGTPPRWKEGPPLGGLAASQTPLLSRGASSPGPPDLDLADHEPCRT